MSAKKPKHKYRRLRVDEVAFVDKGASLGARITFWKRHDMAEEAKAMTLDDVLAKLSEEEKSVVLQAIQDAGKAPEVPEAPAAKDADGATTQTTSNGGAKITLQMKALEALPAEVRKQLEEAAELRTRVAKMEEENLTRVYVEKAQKFPHIPGLNRAELAEVLKSADLGRALPKDLGAKLEKSLRSIDEVIAKSDLFREAGSSFDGGESDAEHRARAIAKQLKERDPKLTDSQAYVEALRQNPSLYDEMKRQGQ